MHNVLRHACRPARAIMVTAAVATATLAGTAASAVAAPPAGHAVHLLSAQASQEFDGFGEGRSAFLALRAARANALQQATAAGFSICSTIFEDSGFDPGFGTFVAESDLSCTG